MSPIDGSIISGRAAWREHDKRHGVTNVADFKNQWESQAREREKFFQGESSYDRKERIEALKHAYEKHTRRR